jgi:hypothetical protein
MTDSIEDVATRFYVKERADKSMTTDERIERLG